MDKFTCIFVIVLVVPALAKSKSVEIIKFTGVECESLDEKVVKVESCELLSNGKVNLNLHILEPMNDISGTILTRRKGSPSEEYRNIFKTPEMKYCDGIKEKSKNPILNSFIEQIQADDEVFRLCPYEGHVVIRNLDIKDKKSFAFYLSGIYQTVLEIKNRGSDVLKLTFENLIETNVKIG